MPKAYSMDLRERVAALHERTGASAQAAARYDVSESWVRDLVRRRREAGTLAPRPAGRKADQRAYDDDADDEAKVRRPGQGHARPDPGRGGGGRRQAGQPGDRLPDAGPARPAA